MADSTETETVIDCAFLLELRGQISGELVALSERRRRLLAQQTLIERALGMTRAARLDPERSTATAAPVFATATVATTQCT